jgi:hypothetical protein
MNTSVNRPLIITVGVVLLGASGVRAATCTWNGTVSQEWSEPSLDFHGKELT